MFRTQPPGFRWLVGGFALLAAIAFGVQYRSDRDGAELILGVVCLAIAGYWLIVDRFVEQSSGEIDGEAGNLPDEVDDEGWQGEQREDDDDDERWPQA